MRECRREVRAYRSAVDARIHHDALVDINKLVRRRRHHRVAQGRIDRKREHRRCVVDVDDRVHLRLADRLAEPLE